MKGKVQFHHCTYLHDKKGQNFLFLLSVSSAGEMMLLKLAFGAGNIIIRIYYKEQHERVLSALEMMFQ